MLPVCLVHNVMCPVTSDGRLGSLHPHRAAGCADRIRRWCGWCIHDNPGDSRHDRRLQTSCAVLCGFPQRSGTSHSVSLADTSAHVSMRCVINRVGRDNPLCLPLTSRLSPSLHTHIYPSACPHPSPLPCHTHVYMRMVSGCGGRLHNVHRHARDVSLVHHRGPGSARGPQHSGPGAGGPGGAING
jgi:hypothetical protein